MREPRELTEAYLNNFIQAIKNDNPVVFVKADNLLAVDHPELGYLVLALNDTVKIEGEGGKEVDEE